MQRLTSTTSSNNEMEVDASERLLPILRQIQQRKRTQQNKKVDGSSH